MKSFTLVYLLTVAACVHLVSSEISNHQDQNKPEYHTDKDLKDAKERWIVNEDEMWDDDMMQHPIDEGPRRVHRDNGEVCTYSHDCASGCCQLERKTKIRSCQPMAQLNERCTNAQVKADTFVDACPCQAGYDFCSFPGEVCTK